MNQDFMSNLCVCYGPERESRSKVSHPEIFTSMKCVKDTDYMIESRSLAWSVECAM